MAHVVDIPAAVLLELLCFVGLMPLLAVDHTMPWQDLLVATDASPAYGFGVSVAPCSPELHRENSRCATRHGTHVRLDKGVDHHISMERERPGQERLPISKSAFAAVISALAKFAAHSGALEATGVSLALRWLLRQPRRLRKRTTLLVDASAVVGALRKGDPLLGRFSVT